MSQPDVLLDGLYDRLITESVERLVEELGDASFRTVRELGPEEAGERLAESLGRQLALLLDELQGEGSEKARQQLALTNALLVNLRRQAQSQVEHLDAVADPVRVLQAVHRASVRPELPDTGLMAPWLFTAGKASPSLLTELRREIASCDSADLLVSFITVSGVRKLQDILQAATAIDASGKPRTRLRVLTTTYTGATEMAALDYLARLPGCEIKVSLDGRRTRLHAKAWVFHRNTGFGSAYVGSANLSGAALLGGLEWTVKFTQHSQEALFSRATAHFETLWNDTEFQHYDPDNPQHRQELARALKRESGEEGPAVVTFFDLVPKDYQKEMLEQLVLEPRVWPFLVRIAFSGHIFLANAHPAI
jgi:HKD family nuclease